MKINIYRTKYKIQIDKSKEPAWSELVQRWYQLDNYSYSLAEIIFRYPYSFEQCSRIILSCPESSYETDLNFVREKISAKLFVHTLPNVRILTVMNIKNWMGEVITIDHGTESLENALLNSIIFLKADESQEVIVIHSAERDGYYEHSIYLLKTQGKEIKNTSSVAEVGSDLLFIDLDETKDDNIKEIKNCIKDLKLEI